MQIVDDKFRATTWKAFMAARTMLVASPLNGCEAQDRLDRSYQWPQDEKSKAQLEWQHLTGKDLQAFGILQGAMQKLFGMGTIFHGSNLIEKFRTSVRLDLLVQA